MILSELEYRDLCDQYMGVCTECEALRNECEPDAENYECEECGAHSVMGIEQALMSGLIDIS